MKPILILTLISFSLNSDFFNLSASEEEINEFLKSGNQFGYFTYKEFWDWFEIMRSDPKN